MWQSWVEIEHCIFQSHYCVRSTAAQNFITSVTHMNYVDLHVSGAMNKGILIKILNKLPSEGFQFSLGRNMICTMFTLYPLVVFAQLINNKNVMIL